MLKLFIKLSALCLGLCYATTSNCQKIQQSHMESLHERMNEMINALYSSPLLSKIKPTSTPETPRSEYSPATYEQPTYAYTAAYPATTAAPQVIYVAGPPPILTPPPILAPAQTSSLSVSPSLYYLSPGVPPVDQTQPATSNPYPRSAYPPPPYSHEYNYPPNPYPVYSYYPPPPYPCEYSYSYPEPNPSYHKPSYPPPPSSPPPPYQPPSPYQYPPYQAPTPYAAPPPTLSYAPSPYRRPELPPQYG